MPTNRDNDALVSESTRLLSDGEGSMEEGTKEEIAEIKNLSLTVAALSFGLLVHSYLLVSVFPYSGFLAMHLIPMLNEENAGSYAGFIASSFMLGRTISSFEWGKAADKYGRVFVIKSSLFLSAIFSIFFGLAPTFSVALIVRFMLGMCNGLIGPIKTLVSEYARGDQKMEAKMMSTVIGMWGFGFLINPAMSGYLSDPIKQYPDSELVKAFAPILEKFPFFLPNLVGCMFCLVGYAMVHNFVEETLPKEKRLQFRWSHILPCIDNNSVMIRNVSSWGLFKHLHNSDGEISEEMNLMMSPSEDKHKEEIEIVGDRETATIFSLMKREGTRQHLLVYWVYSFISITIDEVLPLYCISKTSGLSVTEKIIGNVLTGTGFFFVCLQYILTTKLVDKYGIYKALRIGTFLSMPLSMFIPISLITNKGATDGTLTLTSLVFLSINLALIRSFSSVVFSTITIACNRTVPATQRATMNGLSMLGGSFAKGFGPLFGGILFSTSVGHVTPPFGSVVVYAVTAIMGICLGMQTYFLSEYDGEPTKTAEGKSVDPDPEVETEEPPTF